MQGPNALGWSVVNLWWLDPSSALRWSIEERRVKQAIWGISFPMFLVFFWPQILLFRHLGINNHVGTVVGILTAIPGALAASRVICGRLWSDLLRRADAAAVQRSKRRETV
jgi:hypothetical protein